MGIFDFLKPKPANRLQSYFSLQQTYQIFIGMPLDIPDQWVPVRGLHGRALVTDNFGLVPLARVRAFLVAYSNGEILDYEKLFPPLPAGIHSIKVSRTPVADVLRLEDVQQGAQYIDITFGPSAMARADKYYYSTTLRNRTPQRIQVTKFAGYSEIEQGCYRVHTVTKAYFTADEFLSWYGLKDEWIPPNGTACDPHNYGGPGSLWAYFCQFESGEEFIAGATVPGDIRQYQPRRR
jgi:hypothetical protein